MSDPELPRVPSQTKTDVTQNQTDSCNEFVFQDITEHFEEPALINDNKKKNQFSQPQPQNINPQASIIINNTTNSVVNNTYYYSANGSNSNSYDKFQNTQSSKRKPSFENPCDFSKQTLDDAQINYIQNSIAIENSKDPTRNYHSYKLLESLYDSLLLVGDFHLALQVSELIYSSFLLNERDFISKNACLYYAYLRNLQFVKDLENIYYLNSDCNVIPLTNCILEEGRFSTQFMNFRPVVNIGLLSDFFQQKIRSLEETTTIKQKFCEGDFVMVFVHTFPNQTIEFSFLAKLVEIANDFQIKLEALLTGELLNALNDQNKVWAMRKLNNVVISENASKNLIKLCCSDAASLNLSGIILNPSNLNPALELKNNEELTLKNGLNEFQNKALKDAIFNPLTVIDGPKNSGKTVTTIELMLEWYLLLFIKKIILVNFITFDFFFQNLNI